MSKSVYIIGGGPSLRYFEFDKLKDKEVIAVNKAIITYPYARYFVTMDPSFLSKVSNTQFDMSNATKVFVISLFGDEIVERDGHFINTKSNKIYNLNPYDIIIKSKKHEGFATEFRDFRSGANSGYSALQLAILLGYSKIYLLGFDLDFKYKNTHYHGGYTGQNKEKLAAKFKRDLKRFREALIDFKEKRPDIKIYSCSCQSKLNDLLPYRKV